MKKIQLGFSIFKSGGDDLALYFFTKDSTKISVSYLDSADTTKCRISLIHETFSRLAEIYSGLTVKSEYYGREDSQINPIISGVGDGALKAITSGFKLRNGKMTDGTLPKLEISFKDLFLNLNAIDNIGWGFSTGSGVDYIRVEDWKWFYKSDYEIMTIDAPANKKGHCVIMYLHV